MFVNTKNKTVVTQFEHARLAACIANYINTDVVDTGGIEPSIIKDALMFHHLGYGFFDTIDFRTLDSNEMLEIFRKDTDISLEYKEAEILVLMHHRRLIRKHYIGTEKETSDFVSLEKELSNKIQDSIKSTHFSQDSYLKANRLVHLCDRISFQFCSGVDTSDEVPVFFKDSGKVKVFVVYNSEIEGSSVNKPVFSLKEICKSVVSIDQENFPEVLVPKTKLFRLLTT